MTQPACDDLLEHFDRRPLNARYWTSFAIIAAIAVMDFADFFFIGFILSVIGREWQLTYWQSAAILYGGGIGSIVAALLWGYMSDRWGRRLLIVSGTCICAISSGLIGFLPDGHWQGLVALRILVGFGLAAAATPSLALIVESTPTRHRTTITSLFMVFSSLGILLAATSAGLLLGTLGWRGLSFLGAAPLIPALLAYWFVPESARWLHAAGRQDQARAEITRQIGRELPTAVLKAAPATRKVRLRDLYATPRLFWQTMILNACSLTVVFGYYLWGPSILADVHGATAQTAARYFMIIALSGAVGRVVVALIAPRLGRRRCGVVCALAAAASLAAIALSAHLGPASGPTMIALIAMTAFFCEGGLANLAPFAIEQYGARLGARAAGLAQAASGIGRIVGPLILALLAGASNIVAPAMTQAAVAPTFLVFAACMIAVALAFLFLAKEMHGRRMD